MNKSLGYWLRDMLNFYSLEKGMGMVFLPHVTCDFSRKMFLVLNFMNWPNFMAWLPLLLEVLVNMCIAIAT